MKQKIESSLKEAMRSGDDVRRRTLRMALAGIKNAEIDKGGPLEEPVNRPDLEADSQAEIRVLEAFLPQPFSDEELRSLVEQAIAETQASLPSDMGKVMKTLQPKIQGRAPGDKISAMVKSLLLK
jgi:uncharacterized protein YqeY